MFSPADRVYFEHFAAHAYDALGPELQQRMAWKQYSIARKIERKIAELDAMGRIYWGMKHA